MKVCDVCDLVNGRAFKPSDWGSYGLPIVRIQNLNNEAAPFNYYSGEYNPAHEINNGELLFSWSGTPGTSFGAFRWYRGKGILNQHIYKVVPKIDIDKDYLKFALNGNLSRIISKAHGGVGLQHITKKELNEITLRIVSNDEQRKIVALLNQTQNVIFHRQAQLAKLDELVKCRFVELFIGKGYPRRELQSLIQDGTSISYGIVQPGDDGTGNIGLLRPVDFHNGSVVLDNLKYIGEAISNLSRKTILEGNELLITVRGTTGLTALTNSNHRGMNVTRGIAVVKYDGRKIVPEYLQAVMSSDESQTYIREHTRGATLQQINLSDLRIQSILVPPFVEQHTFADFVRRIDKLRFVIQQSLDETQKLFDSLMQEYFD